MAGQLLEMGYFLCAPCHPTLAVEVCMLLFIMKLFVPVSPNNTAWCTTVEDFLKGLGYHLASAVCAYFFTHPSDLVLFNIYQGSLRCRFGVALMWFNSLQAATTSHTNKVLLCVLKLITELDDGIQQPAPSETPSASHACSGHRTTVEVEEEEDPTVEVEEDQGPSGANLPQGSRKGQGHPQSFPFPSPPLRHVQVIICGLSVHCALVGRRAMTLKGVLFIFILYSYPSSQHPSRPDAIVCVDACFMQKHNQQIRDPARHHPRTVFIAEADVQHMENYVDNILPVKPRNKKKKANSSTDESTLEEDSYEGPLCVLTSILDGCERSFLAADER